MDPISAIITGVLLIYKVLDTFVFQPDKRRGNSKSIFNLTDFNRPKDKHDRAPQSIFTKFIGVNDFGQPYFDKAIIYAGHKNEVLYGFVDKNEGFNADSIFELWCFFVYWHGGQKAKDIVFGKIINPMFNLGLKTVNNASTSHRFTAPDRRFFMLYDDILRLQQIANADDGKFNITIYTQNRKNAINVNTKDYAKSLLNTLANYPFTSGYFVDGLGSVPEILNKELKILTDIKSSAQTDNPANTPGTSTQNTQTSTQNATNKKSDSILHKVIIGLIVAIIISLVFGLIKKFTKNGKK